MKSGKVLMTCGGLEESRTVSGLFNKILESERIQRNGGEEY